MTNSLPNLVCKVMGAVFIVVAIWGFIDGEHVLIFHVNTAHNIVHLVSGVLALACGFSGPAAAYWFSVIFGSVYGLVATLGLLNVKFVNDLLHLNDADDFLHLAIAGVFLAAAFLSKSRPATRPPQVALRPQ